MIAWDEQTDVIVVGSGVAGLPAAIEAKQAAASVLVFEKMKVTGDTPVSAMEAWLHRATICRKERG